MKKLKAAIGGVENGHVVSIVKMLHNNPHVEIVAATDASPHENAALIEKAQVTLTHGSFEEMLQTADFDFLVSGVIYKHRGPQAIAALRAGRHVIGDKPLCLTLTECDEISRLSREQNLSVMAYLSLPYSPLWRAAREQLQNGAIGEIATVFVSGRHELKFSSRPAWFFEPHGHGGPINDILVHGIHGVEWLSGLKIEKIVAARSWNQQLKNVPHFQDCAQALFQMNNGAGTIMDGSFTKSAGHKEPWTFHFHGTKGDLRLTNSDVILRCHNEPALEITPSTAPSSSLVEDFIAEITKENGSNPTLSTEDCLRSTRTALLAQDMANSL